MQKVVVEKKFIYGFVAGFLVALMATWTVLETRSSMEGGFPDVSGNRPKTNRTTRVLSPSSTRRIPSHRDPGEAEQMVSKNPQMNNVDDVGPRLFNESKGLTSALIEKHGLSDNEVQQVQKALGKFIRTGEDLMAKRAVYNASESDPEKRIWVYNIRALPDRGKELLESFRKDLVESVDPGIGSSIFDEFNRRRNDVKMLGGFGAYDAKIKFHPVVDDGKEVESVVFEYCDPDTGNRVRTAQTTLDEFVRMYGDVFDLEVMRENPE